MTEREEAVLREWATKSIRLTASLHSDEQILEDLLAEVDANATPEDVLRSKEVVREAMAKEQVIRMGVVGFYGCQMADSLREMLRAM